MIDYKIKLFKVLSKNDTGETNSHQSGISIPKFVAKTDVFPQLTKETLNPRVSVLFFDENNIKWEFQYIYYNDIYYRDDKKRGHNEYRITCVKDFIKEYGIKSGDKIIFGMDSKGVKRIWFEKNEATDNNESTDSVLTLKGGWKFIKY